MFDLSYLMLAIPVALAVALGVMVPLLANLLYRRFDLGAAYICGVFLLDSVSLSEGGINVGINLFYADLFLGLLAGVAGLRFAFAKDCPPKNVAWLLFCALVALSLVTGLMTYGTGAGVQARAYFYFIATGLYGMSFETTERRVQTALNALAVTALALVGLTLYRWVVYFTPITSLMPPEGSYNSDGPIRVIFSSHALVIAQVFVGALFYATASRGFLKVRLLAPLLLGIVLVLQHRSVWLAGLVGITTRFFIGKSRYGVKSKQLLILAAMVAIVTIPLVANEKLADVWQQIGAGASRAIAMEGSAGERLQSWQEIAKKWYAAGPRSIVIGQSFGTDNSRLVKIERGETRLISYFAHNLYVQTLFNTGLIGLLALLTATWYVLGGLYRICQSDDHGPIPEVLLVLIVMQFAYYMPYEEDYLQSFIFGIALAYVAGKKAAAAAVSIGRNPALGVM
jgi:O-antigen ligase